MVPRLLSEVVNVDPSTIAIGDRVTLTWEDHEGVSLPLFTPQTRGTEHAGFPDAGRAAAGPFGATIAHGMLTLSLVPIMAGQVYRVEGARMGINYGFGKVRFPAPVPVGSKLRGSVTLLSVTDVDGGVQVSGQVTIEREGTAKPVCVAESLSRFYL